VPLTQGHEATIDAADVHLVEGFNWRALVTSSAVYAVRTDCSGQKQRKIYLHRVIMGDPESVYVDHRDSDGLNNRRGNLRAATRSQNNHNSRVRTDNTSGIKGVVWHKPRGKWAARIKLNGKNRHLGLFRCPTAAALAYAKASRALHGEFGRVA